MSKLLSLVYISIKSVYTYSYILKAIIYYKDIEIIFW